MRIIFTLTLLLAANFASAGDAAVDPEHWYMHDYAPLWAENPGAKVEQMAGFYAETVNFRDGEGGLTLVNGREWMASAIEGWLADNWIGSGVVGLKVDRLNATTTAFKSRWLDRYSDREDEFSCGWYLANFSDGKWFFTDYAAIDCAAHEL